MSVDKLIDSTKLDACCTAEANAIRAKSGGSAQIAYDYANNKGFADAIAAIPSGGADMSALEIYVADFLSDPPSVTSGALNSFHRILVS